MAKRYDPSKGKMTKCMSPESKVGTGRCTHLASGVLPVGSKIEVKPVGQRTPAEENMIKATRCEELVELPGVTLTTDGKPEGRLKVDPKEVKEVVKRLKKSGVKVVEKKAGNNINLPLVTREGAEKTVRRYNAKTVEPISKILSTEEVNELGVQGAVLVNGNQIIAKNQLTGKQIVFLKQKNIKLAKRTTEINEDTVVVINNNISKVAE